MKSVLTSWFYSYLLAASTLDCFSYRVQILTQISSMNRSLIPEDLFLETLKSTSDLLPGASLPLETSRGGKLIYLQIVAKTQQRCLFLSFVQILLMDSKFNLISYYSASFFLTYMACEFTKAPQLTIMQPRSAKSHLKSCKGDRIEAVPKDSCEVSLSSFLSYSCQYGLNKCKRTVADQLDVAEKLIIDSFLVLSLLLQILLRAQKYSFSRINRHTWSYTAALAQLDLTWRDKECC